MDDFDEELYLKARIEEERAETEHQTKALYAKLLASLEKKNRRNEIFRAIQDEVFRNQLIQEFNLQ